MNKIKILVTIATLMLAAQVSLASEEDMVQYACIACHELDYTKIGPAFYDVADRYRDADEEMIKELARRVKEGSSGNWGLMQMTPQPAVPEEAADKLVRWILTLQRP